MRVVHLALGIFASLASFVFVCRHVFPPKTLVPQLGLQIPESQRFFYERFRDFKGVGRTKEAGAVSADNGVAASASAGESQWLNPSFGTLENSKVMKLVHASQHPADCSTRKFLVYSMPKHSQHDTRNLGAMVTSVWRWVAVAMEGDYTLVVDSVDWNMASCPDNQTPDGGLACYFEKFSKCNMKDVEAAGEAIQLKNNDLATIREIMKSGPRVVACTKSYSPLVDKTLVLPSGDKLDDIKDCQFMMGVVGYFMRMNSQMVERVKENVLAALPADFDPARSIGMPIRASDKCKGHSLTDGSAKGEMTCIPFNQYMVEAEKIRTSNPTVNTIILTSEDPNIIEQSKNFSASPAGAPWRFVYNVRDVLQGTGSSTSVTTSNVVQAREKSGSRRLTSLTHMEVMTSMLTSQLMQLHGRFLLTHFKSSFLLLMGVFHENCDACCPAKDRKTIWLFPNPMCKATPRGRALLGSN